MQNGRRIAAGARLALPERLAFRSRDAGPIGGGRGRELKACLQSIQHFQRGAGRPVLGAFNQYDYFGSVACSQVR